MGRILYLLCCITLLSACVTEKTFIDSKKQVRSFEFDRDEAARTRLILALSYLETNRFEQAKFNLEKALEFNPERADVNYSLGYYYQMVGEMEIAEKYYLEAIDLEPQNPDTLNNYGTFLCNVGQLDKAAVYFKKAINISKYTRAADSYENLAICALSNDQILQAQEYFEMSYKHNPSRAYNLLSLAGIKYATGDLIAALNFYTRFNRIGQATPRSLLLGYILETKRGRLNQANQYADQIIANFPESNEALYITTKTVINSEFEQLRLKYQAKHNNSPKIKITRKTASNSLVKPKKVNSPSKATYQSKPGGSALALPTVIATAVKQVATQSEFEAELKQKVAMFSKPLTDTESVSLPAEVKSSVVIRQETPLPTEEILLKEVASAKLVNDRATTVNNREYTEIQPVKLIVPTYEVQPGDNLYRISVTFNVKVERLVAWNALSKAEVSVGQTLFVADPEPYVVLQKEQQLSDVAKQQKVELEALLRWNSLDQDGWLKEGQKVLVADPSWYTTRQQADAMAGLGEPISVDSTTITIPTHKVKSGEFLYKISKDYNVKLDTLIKWNNLTSKAKLKVGQVIYVGNPDVYYTLPQSQSMELTAKRIGINVQQLKDWNSIDQDGVLSAGTRLLKVNPEQYQ